MDSRNCPSLPTATQLLELMQGKLQGSQTQGKKGRITLAGWFCASVNWLSGVLTGRGYSYVLHLECSHPKIDQLFQCKRDHSEIPALAFLCTFLNIL